MLRKRVVTAVVLLALFLLALFAMSPVAFALLLAAVCVPAALEWSKLCGGRPVVGAALVVGIEVLAYPFPAMFVWIIGAGVAWWIWGAGRLGVEPTVGRCRECYFRGVLILVPAWAALVWLRDEFGPYGVLAVLLIVWLADTGAYFCGKRWGRHKLAPRVSPGKTVEGLAGGLIAVCVFALASASWASDQIEMGLPAWVSLCLGAALFSVVGDLVESKAKRAAGVKDSGTLLPGHGGVLDRMDGVVAAVPIFALGLYWMSSAS